MNDPKVLPKDVIDALLLSQRLNREVLPKFNWGASFLDAEAIDLLNRVPGIVDAALTNAGITAMKYPMELQRKEFDAVDALAKALNSMPAVVDDDYPEGRHNYESALANLIAAMKRNGRFDANNRYGVIAK